MRAFSLRDEITYSILSSVYVTSTGFNLRVVDIVAGAVGVVVGVVGAAGRVDVEAVVGVGSGQPSGHAQLWAKRNS